LGLPAEVNFESVPANLPLLLKLSMSNNYTTGKISDKLSGFKGLQFMDVSDRFFPASLPVGIGK
jgi:hypothetical protein